MQASDTTSRDLQSILSRLNPQPSPECRTAILQLKESHRHSTQWTSLPKGKLAAVLILLSINHLGELQVTLTTRALSLRSHPGDTALPGGRFETATDRTPHDTALREAQEEIDLVLADDCQAIHLADLPLTVSRNLLFVIPTVYLLISPASYVLPALVPNSAEVSAIFHIPLKSLFCLEDQPNPQFKHWYKDVGWLEGSKYRLHNIGHDGLPSNVVGLTADILLKTASIAYAPLEASFITRAPTQLTWAQLVASVLDGNASHVKDLRELRST